MQKKAFYTAFFCSQEHFCVPALWPRRWRSFNSEVISGGIGSRALAATLHIMHSEQLSCWQYYQHRCIDRVILGGIVAIESGDIFQQALKHCQPSLSDS